MKHTSSYQTNRVSVYIPDETLNALPRSRGFKVEFEYDWNRVEQVIRPLGRIINFFKNFTPPNTTRYLHQNGDYLIRSIFSIDLERSKHLKLMPCKAKIEENTLFSLVDLSENMRPKYGILLRGGELLNAENFYKLYKSDDTDTDRNKSLQDLISSLHHLSNAPLICENRAETMSFKGLKVNAYTV